MKKIFSILFFFLLLAGFSEVFSQNHSNSGTITNYGTGTFIIKSGQFDNNNLINNEGEIKVEKNTLNSTGFIKNDSDTKKGKIIITSTGGTILKQDSINGYVEFNSEAENNYQVIPILNYEKIKLKGNTKRIQKDSATAVKNILNARSLFVTEDGTQVQKMTSDVEINSNKRTEHDGKFLNAVNAPTINFLFRSNTDSLNSLVNGTGEFRELEIDNPNGVDITRGGFKVNSKLILKSGKLNNSTTANFKLADNAEIIIHPEGNYPANLKMADQTSIDRYTNSALNIKPEFEGRVNVSYKGGGHIVTTGELPDQPNILEGLEIENVDGVTLSHDMYLADRANIYSKLITESDSLGKFQAIIQNPGQVLNFDSDSSEIVGTVARMDLETNRNILFNNQYTYLNFAKDSNDLRSDNGLIDTVKVRVVENADWDTQTQWGNVDIPDSENKVKRIFDITAIDESNNTEINSISKGVTFGYAWRNSGRNRETPSSTEVNFNELVLLRLFVDGDGNYKWTPQLDTIKGQNDGVWAHSESRIDGTLDGHFGLGLSPIDFLRMLAKVVLEGPYNQSTKRMNTSLQDSSYLPIQRPPDVYPYNLDPTREEIDLATLPDSTVDWIVVEFRENLYDINTDEQRFFRTCLLHADGSLMDFDGNKTILLSTSNTKSNSNVLFDTTGENGGYYMAIRHRNHLTVVTDEKIDLRYYDSDSSVIDFSNDLSMIASKNLKLLNNDNGNPVWAMLGGNAERLNFDGPPLPEGYDNSLIYIDEVDYQQIWDHLGQKGYLPYDIKMDGIVTTKDYNTSWNNRTKTSIIKGGKDD